MGGTRFRPEAYQHVEAAQLIARGLERTDAPLRDVCRAAGVGLSTLQNWLNGRSEPFRDNLERLANALGEPGLLDALTWHWRVVVMVCTTCGVEQEMEPHKALRAGRHLEATFDQKTGRGTWLCFTCGHRELIEQTPILKGYRRELKKRGKDRAKVWLRSKGFGPTPASVQALVTTASNKRGPQSDEHRAKLALRKMAVQSTNGVWVFDYCEACGQLLRWLRTASERRRHRGCMSSALWMPQPGNRRLSREQLATTFEMVLRNLAGGKSIDKLAGSEGVVLDRRSIAYRIAHFVECLPEDDRGGIKLRRLGEVLRYAASQEGREWAKSMGRV